MAEKRKVELYSCDEGCEQLTHEEPDEAIEESLDCSTLDMNNLDPDETITVFRYRFIHPTVASCGSPLDDLLETLDQDHGDPDGPDDATVVMKEAEAIFVAAVLAEYVPWSCKVAGSATVNVLAWVKENRPDWITENEPIARAARDRFDSNDGDGDGDGSEAGRRNNDG